MVSICPRKSYPSNLNSLVSYSISANVWIYWFLYSSLSVVDSMAYLRMNFLKWSKSLKSLGLSLFLRI